MRPPSAARALAVRAALRSAPGACLEKKEVQLQVRTHLCRVPQVRRALYSTEVSSATQRRAHCTEKHTPGLPPWPQVPVDKISLVIGSGGKTIKSIIEDSKVDNIDIQDTGTVWSRSCHRVR